MPNRDERWHTRVAAPTIGRMAVHADPTVPIHPLTGSDVDAMVRAGILAEDDRLELLDGVLVEMSPPGKEHSAAVRELTTLAAHLVGGRDKLQLSVQGPLELHAGCRPEPDLAVVPATAGWHAHAAGALLVIEVSMSSLALDLGAKAAAYARAGVPDYWVLDLEGRRLVVHRRPVQGQYRDVVSMGELEAVTAERVALTVPIAAVLPPR